MDHLNLTQYSQMSQFNGRRTEVYMVMGILSFLSVMGTVGNALVLYVFAKKKDCLTSTLFILALAFVDFTTCLIVIPYTIYMEFVNFFLSYDFLCKLYQFLITSNLPFSALILVAIAIDRYFGICHPFLHAMTRTRAKILIACLGMFSIGLGIIVGLMYGIYNKVTAPLPSRYMPFLPGKGSLMENATGISGHRIEDSHHDLGPVGKATAYSPDQMRDLVLKAAANKLSGDNMMYNDVQIIIVHTGKCDPSNIYLDEVFQKCYQKFYTAMYVVCLIIVIVLYVLLYKSVLCHRTELTQLATVNQQRESSNLKMAAMLSVVTVVFIVTLLPAFLMALEFIPYSMTVFYMYYASNVANPVIYYFMSKTFRDDLKKLFCG